MRRIIFIAAAGAAALLAAGAASSGIADDVYTVHNLVGDTSGAAPGTDATLVNGWGLSAGPTTPWWVSDNGTNSTTLYNGAGAKQALTVAVPGAPTGTVFNGSATDFAITQSGKSGAARFLFSTEGGQILGWSPTVNAATAIPGVDRSSTGAVYKGLTTVRRQALRDRLPQQPRRRVRCVVQSGDGIVHGSEAAGGLCAVRDPGAERQHLRHVREAGRRQEGRRAGQRETARRPVHDRRAARRARRVRRQEELAAERAVGARPRADGLRGVRGRSADRQLRQRPRSAYQDRGGGKWVFKGQLRKGDQTIVTIDGLWAIAFGNGSAGGPTSSLYFAAGPGGESHGLFGAITAG